MGHNVLSYKSQAGPVLRKLGQTRSWERHLGIERLIIAKRQTNSMISGTISDDTKLQIKLAFDGEELNQSGSKLIEDVVTVEYL